MTPSQLSREMPVNKPAPKPIRKGALRVVEDDLAQIHMGLAEIEARFRTAMDYICGGQMPVAETNAFALSGPDSFTSKIGDRTAAIKIIVEGLRGELLRLEDVVG